MEGKYLYYLRDLYIQEVVLIYNSNDVDNSKYVTALIIIKINIISIC